MTISISRAWAAILAVALGSPGATEAAERILVSSTAFPDGGEIPSICTCQGKNTPPPLSWSNVPEGVKSFALTVDDPDAPKPPFVHWVLYDIPPDANGLNEGVKVADLPPGTLQGVNGANKVGYTGPCPPTGRHRYFFRVYALDTVLAPRPRAPTMEELEKAMRGHVLARGEMLGTYEKAPP